MLDIHKTIPKCMYGYVHSVNHFVHIGNSMIHTCEVSIRTVSMNVFVKAKLYAISSDTHQLQFIKLHHFKQDIF